MPGRVLIVEPALLGDRGHQPAAARRFAELVGGRRTVIVGGASWRGAAVIGGATVVALFKSHRQAVSRMRWYGPLLRRIVGIAEMTAGPVNARILRRRGRMRTDAPVPRANGDGTMMASVMIEDMRRCVDVLRAGPNDHLFMPSAGAEQILAAAELLNSSDDAPAIHLRLMYDDSGCHPTDPTWRSALASSCGLAVPEKGSGCWRRRRPSPMPYVSFGGTPSHFSLIPVI